MLQVYFRKINQNLENVQTVSNYQVKFQPFTSEEAMS